jgi:hypothetical protein
MDMNRDNAVATFDDAMLGPDPELTGEAVAGGEEGARPQDAALSLVMDEGAQKDPEEYDEALCRLLTEFEAQQAIPEHLRGDFAQMGSDRQYVHTDVLLPQVTDAVCTNLVLRNQYVRLTQTYAKDPDLSVQPKKLLQPVPAIEAIIDQASAMAVQAEYDEAMLDFRMQLQKLGMFGRTVEVLVKHFADECQTRAHLLGAIQDATTVGIAWLKVSWIESLGQDPIGLTRPNDFQDTVNRYTRLVDEFDRQVFDESDQKYQQMTDLAMNIREKVKAEAWKTQAWGDQDPREMRSEMAAAGKRMPRLDPTEIPRYQGFTIDPVMPEDLRFDWQITRPEEFRRCRWMAHCVRMTWEDVAEQFGLTEEDLNHYRSDKRYLRTSDPRLGVATSAVTTVDPAERDEEGKAANDDRPLVWERWDRAQNRVYVWVEGTDRCLASYEPEVVSRFWYPFFPLYFNRVTGKALPISDTKLTRQLNDEFNLLRTHDREGRRAAYNKYIVAKGFFSEDEMRNLRACPPEGVIECERADEVAKYFSRVIGSNYNPALYDTNKVRMDLDAMSGTTSAARGATGSANFAKEEESAQNMAAAEADRHRESVENMLGDVFRHMAEILVEVFPESNAKAIAGPGAYWPHLDRATLWRALQLDIEAGSTGKPDRARRIAELKEVIGLVTTLVPLDPTVKPKSIEWIRDLLDATDSRKEAEDYVQVIPLQSPPNSDVAVAAGTKQESAMLQSVATQPGGMEMANATGGMPADPNAGGAPAAAPPGPPNAAPTDPVGAPA